MIKAFFLDKFEADFRSNQQWCALLEDNEGDLSDFAISSFSHIVNVHHIWISRISGLKIESHTWDQLPLEFLEKLCQENYLKTVDYLEKEELNNTVDYQSEEGANLSKTDVDILYHILNHTTYHRAQIANNLRNNGIIPPVFNFNSIE